MKRRFRVATAAVASFVIVAGIAVSATAGTQAHPDRTFSGDGVSFLNARGEDFSWAVVPDGNHAFLVGGTKKARNAPCAFLVARYDNRGKLDQSFGHRGIRLLTIGHTSCATDATLTPSGQLLVGGWSATKHGVSATLALFRANGSLDRDFSGDGIFRQRVNGGISSPRVEVEPDGTIWLAWSVIRNWDRYTGNYQIAHLRANGGKDATFGQRGVKSVDVRAVDDVVDTAVSPSGRFTLVGWSSRTLKADGLAAIISVDDSGPTYQRTIDQWSKTGTYPISIDATDDGHVVVGTTPEDRPGWGGARLDEQLRYDDTFSGNGLAEHDCRCISHTGVVTAWESSAAAHARSWRALPPVVVGTAN
ncbi:MAG: hypothetical protein ACJ73L_00500 [Actinomycetes bacterium]